MNDNSSNEPKLSDEQMVQLLSVFYNSEVPARLDALPSSWPQIADAAKPAEVSLTTEPANVVSRPASSASRGIAVAVATLAACVMVMVFTSSNLDVGNENAGTETESELMNVSEEGGDGKGGGVVGNGQTTLEEIQNIDLSPEGTSDDENDDK